MKRTQQAIKHALTERWYAWEDARKVAVEDPVHRDEINLNTSDDRPAYIPKTYDVRCKAPLDRIPTKMIRMTLEKRMVTPLISQRLRLPSSNLLKPLQYSPRSLLWYCIPMACESSTEGVQCKNQRLPESGRDDSRVGTRKVAKGTISNC